MSKTSIGRRLNFCLPFPKDRALAVGWMASSLLVFTEGVKPDRVGSEGSHLKEKNSLNRGIREASPPKKIQNVNFFQKGGGGATQKFTFFQTDFLTKISKKILVSQNFFCCS